MSKLLTHDDKFDHAKYAAYSQVGKLDVTVWECAKHLQVYLPVTYALSNFGLQFAAVMALIVWFILEKNAALRRGACTLRSWIRSPRKDTKEGIYKDVPVWWYALTGALSLFCLIVSCEYWPVQLRWYGVLLALAISSILFIPVSVRLHVGLVVQADPHS